MNRDHRANMALNQAIDLALIATGAPLVGTPLAIQDYSIGVAASASSRACKGPRASPRTARIIASRKSEAPTPAAVGNVLAAINFAPKIGQPLNRFVTIHIQAAGGLPGPQLIGQFLKLAGDWLRLRNVQPTYVWVRETGEHKGEHVHIAINVPPEHGRGFGHRQRGWMKAIGLRCWRGVIHTRPIGNSASHAFSDVRYGEAYSDHLTAMIEYLLKSADPATARAYGLAKQREIGGVLVGKRLGTSANIGASARANAAKHMVFS